MDWRGAQTRKTKCWKGRSWRFDAHCLCFACICCWLFVVCCLWFLPVSCLWVVICCLLFVVGGWWWLVVGGWLLVVGCGCCCCCCWSLVVGSLLFVVCCLLLLWTALQLRQPLRRGPTTHLTDQELVLFVVCCYEFTESWTTITPNLETWRENYIDNRLYLNMTSITGILLLVWF